MDKRQTSCNPASRPFVIHGLMRVQHGNDKSRARRSTFDRPRSDMDSRFNGGQPAHLSFPGKVAQLRLMVVSLVHHYVGSTLCYIHMALTKGCRHGGSPLSTLLGHGVCVIAQSRACHRAMLGCLRAHRNRVVENARAARDGSLVGCVATTRLLTSPSPGRDAVRIHERVRTTCVGKNTDFSGVSWVYGTHVRGLLPS